MHWFKRNIGDYHKKAGRLSIIQHGVYMLLMDACYDREKFPTRDDAIDWIWANTDEEIAAVDFVLKRFFTECEGVFIQDRIQEEIDAYQEKRATNKRIANERETKRKQNSTSRAQGVNEAPPNQEPVTSNQEPNKDYKGKPTACPYQEILDVYHNVLPMVAGVSQMTAQRKTKLKNFWSKFKFSVESWEAYLSYIKTNCKWMLEARPNGNGGMWKAKNFDYFITEKCYLSVKEDRACDQ